MLTPQQVLWAASQRQARQPYKRICAALDCSRATVRRALKGLTRSYAGIVSAPPVCHSCLTRGSKGPA